MIVFPNAKINLGLNITSRREDGYHNISSCFVPIGWRDILEAVPADKFSFQSSGLGIPGDSGSNLCVKAFQLLKQDHNIPNVSMHLHKMIPMGAGLGGGSSDGAHTLVLLNQLFDLQLDSDTLESYAKQLGADCPFFIRNQTVLVSGIGEIFEDIDIDLSDLYLTVVYPGIHVNTGLAFKAISPKEPTVPIAQAISNRLEWKHELSNDFESPAFAQHPILEDIKNTMYQSGALYASMTGSGSSVFGLFSDEVKIDIPDIQIWQGWL